MRCERGSAGVVLPAGSRDLDRAEEGRAIRILGLDIHRSFAEVVALEVGVLSALDRVDVARRHLEVFASGLGRDDEVVQEATRDATAMARCCVPMWAVW